MLCNGNVAWCNIMSCINFIIIIFHAGHDAEEAIKAGCKAVYVSNHGARHLDGLYATVSL